MYIIIIIIIYSLVYYTYIYLYTRITYTYISATPPRLRSLCRRSLARSNARTPLPPPPPSSPHPAARRRDDRPSQVRDIAVRTHTHRIIHVVYVLHNNILISTHTHTHAYAYIILYLFLKLLQYNNRITRRRVFAVQRRIQIHG